MSIISILSLGDSYTIGEGVPLYESFPYLVVQALRNNSLMANAPEIIAKTGFTTGELLQEISHTTFLETYSFVTLLIGVNNQYRGLEVAIFEKELIELINFSLEKVNHQSKKIIILSIPNWGLTPFAAERDEEAITQDIQQYNALVKNTCLRIGCNFIDITKQTNLAKENIALLTADGLHYSKESHQQWANEVVKIISLQEM